MSSYLQNYGVGEERRNRIIKWSIIIAVGVMLLSWFSYLFLHNFFETRTVKNFLAEVNSRNYQAAYRDWGCTEATPCPNYDYKRFLEDWLHQFRHGKRAGAGQRTGVTRRSARGENRDVCALVRVPGKNLEMEAVFPPVVWRRPELAST
jgi:hypothetical protein